MKKRIFKNIEMPFDGIQQRELVLIVLLFCMQPAADWLLVACNLIDQQFCYVYNELIFKIKYYLFTYQTYNGLSFHPPIHEIFEFEKCMPLRKYQHKTHILAPRPCHIQWTFRPVIQSTVR